ncbi:MAG TPA: HAD hydrolase-like protein [Candidatus Polarisedimenticolaceae bacterium]
MAGIRGVLVDLDGTLLDGELAAPGAGAFLDRLRSAALPFRVATNNTRRSRAEIADALRRVGLEVAAADVVLPAALARRRIVESGDPRAMLLVPDGARRDFEGVAEAGEDAAWVVIGDLGAGFTFERLDAAFRALHAGGRLLALHRNRYWFPSSAKGPVLDAGGFVAALEFAAGVEAEVVGKPSPAFFRLAVGELGLAPAEVLVVGDSVDNDGVGARDAGCRVAVVRGAAFREERIEASGLRPDLLVDSVGVLEP